MASRYGMSIRYHERDVRPMGRTAMGVKSMDLMEEDYVIDMERLVKDADVLTISENGFGKRTHEGEYRAQYRGGRGIKTMNITEKTGCLSALKVVTGEEDLVIINSDGVIIRIDKRDLTDEPQHSGRNPDEGGRRRSCSFCSQGQKGRRSGTGEKASYRPLLLMTGSRRP